MIDDVMQFRDTPRDRQRLGSASALERLEDPV
jgi:hypothetical protein